MNKKWFCKIGMHKWVGLGKNMMLTDTVAQCKRCKVGKHDVAFGTGQVRYTAEAMKQAWDEGKIDNSKAYEEIYGVQQ